MKVTTILATTATFLLASCAAQPGDLIRGWRENFAEYNVSIVFPPRESFQIGDVYMNYSVDQLPQGQLLQAVHVDRLPLLEEWDTYQQQQLEVPAATAYPATGLFTQPVRAGERLGTKARAGDRMSMAAFPQLEIARVRAASLGLASTGNPILAALGFSSSDDISVKVTKTEQMSVPLRAIQIPFAAWQLRAEQEGSAEGAAICEAYAEMRRRLIIEGVKDPFIVITVPTEVYYTRGLNYSTLKGSAFNAQARAILNATAELSALVDQVEEEGGGNGGEENGTPSRAPERDTQAGEAAPTTAATLSRRQLQELQANVDELQRNIGGFGAGGGELSVSVSDAFGVSLNEDFARPLAFGYRSMTYNAEPIVNALNCDDRIVTVPSGVGPGNLAPETDEAPHTSNAPQHGDEVNSEPTSQNEVDIGEAAGIADGSVAPASKLPAETTQ